MFEDLPNCTYSDAIRLFLHKLHMASFSQILRFGAAFETYILRKPPLSSESKQKSRLVRVLKELVNESPCDGNHKIYQFPRFTVTCPLIDANAAISPVLERKPHDPEGGWTEDELTAAFDVIDHQYYKHHSRALDVGAEVFAAGSSELYPGEFAEQPTDVSIATSLHMLETHVTELFVRMFSSPEEKQRAAAMTFVRATPYELRMHPKTGAVGRGAEFRFGRDWIDLFFAIYTEDRSTRFPGPRLMYRENHPIYLIDAYRNHKRGYMLWSYGLQSTRS